jgi:cytochrome c556
MRKLTCVTVAALAAVTVTTTAFAQEVRPDRVIHYRQAVLRAMNWNFAILAAMVKGKRPFDKDVAAQSALFVDQLAHMPWDAFPPGTDQGAPTKASTDIWKDPAKFKSLQNDLIAATGKLAVAAKAGDLVSLKAPVSTVGDACDNCHDAFREK